MRLLRSRKRFDLAGRSGVRRGLEVLREIRKEKGLASVLLYIIFLRKGTYILTKKKSCVVLELRCRVFKIARYLKGFLNTSCPPSAPSLTICHLSHPRCLGRHLFHSSYFPAPFSVTSLTFSICLTLRHLSNRLSRLSYSSAPSSLSGTPFIL